MLVNMKRMNNDPDYQYQLKQRLLYKAECHELTQDQACLLLELLRDQLQRCRNHSIKNYKQVKAETRSFSQIKMKKIPSWMTEYQQKKLELFFYELRILTKLKQRYFECLPDKQVSDILTFNAYFEKFWTYRRHTRRYMQTNFNRIMTQEKTADHTSYEIAKNYACLHFHVPHEPTLPVIKQKNHHCPPVIDDRNVC